MKKLLLITISVFTFFFSFSQSYKLLPDSCTYCFYSQKTGSIWYDRYYYINPFDDTLINGEIYTEINNGYDPEFFVRQIGNEVWGISPDSTQEHLIMSFDVSIGDTLYDLYSQRGRAGNFYHAVVENIDSINLGGGIYHHFVELTAFALNYDNSGYSVANWQITWNEKGICTCDENDQHVGGLLVNIPVDYMMPEGPNYWSPNYCTTDTLVPIGCNNYGNSCENCNPSFSVIHDKQKSYIEIYPNPSNGEILISLVPNRNDLDLIITDITGKEMYKTKAVSGRAQYLFNSAASGIYFITLRDEFEVLDTKRVIIY